MAEQIQVIEWCIAIAYLHTDRADWINMAGLARVWISRYWYGFYLAITRSWISCEISLTSFVLAYFLLPFIFTSNFTVSYTKTQSLYCAFCSVYQTHSHRRMRAYARALLWARESYELFDVEWSDCWHDGQLRVLINQTGAFDEWILSFDSVALWRQGLIIPVAPCEPVHMLIIVCCD